MMEDRNDKEPQESWIERRIELRKQNRKFRKRDVETKRYYKKLLHKTSFIRSYGALLDDQEIDRDTSEEIMGLAADVVVSFHQVTQVFKDGIDHVGRIAFEGSNKDRSLFRFLYHVE